MSPTECRLCRSQETTQLARGAARYARCRRCAAVTRLMSADEYAALVVSYDPDPLLLARDPVELRGLLAVPHKIGFLRRALGGRESPAGLRFLDIGCGQGGYLLAARELGLEVEGVEPSEAHSAIARDVFGLRVRTCYFTRDLFPPGSFDLVMLSHVIEHIYDPDAFLASILPVMRPGGKLVIVTPNSDSLIARASGAWWTMLKPADHVSLMSSRTLSFMPSLARARVVTRTSEYPSEPAMALLAAARDMVRHRLRPAESTVAATTRPGDQTRRRARRKLLDAALAVVSLPAHRLTRLSNKQATLVAEITLEAP